MHLIYNISIYIVKFSLSVIAIFNPKIKRFIRGRKSTYKQLSALKSDRKTLWFHCASLGEFEQGRPIIEACKRDFPQYQLLVTFFSPSGYEIRKNYAVADVVVYLPLDTRFQAKKFIQKVNPSMAIFIKYEFWPNYLTELHKNNIKTILVSGVFRSSQPFFTWYGGWMKKSLTAFHHFFVQDMAAKKLLSTIGISRTTISGDTRFDRVFSITKEDFKLQAIQDFKGENQMVVAGSTWPKDEELLIKYLNSHPAQGVKFIIAPHSINASAISNLRQQIKKNTALFSNKNFDPVSTEVLIIDSIGLLSKLYKYADIAYVGGGFGTGIHNILEPATFGIPICIGPTYSKFNEAVDLVALGACSVIETADQLQSTLNQLLGQKKLQKERGSIASTYVTDRLGATQMIMSYLQRELR